MRKILTLSFPLLFPFSNLSRSFFTPFSIIRTRPLPPPFHPLSHLLSGLSSSSFSSLPPLFTIFCRVSLLSPSCAFFFFSFPIFCQAYLLTPFHYLPSSPSSIWRIFSPLLLLTTSPLPSILSNPPSILLQVPSCPPSLPLLPSSGRPTHPPHCTGFIAHVLSISNISPIPPDTPSIPTTYPHTLPPLPPSASATQLYHAPVGTPSASVAPSSVSATPLTPQHQRPVVLVFSQCTRRHATS